MLELDAVIIITGLDDVITGLHDVIQAGSCDVIIGLGGVMREEGGR